MDFQSILALQLLKREGVVAIWNLHIAATAAYRSANGEGAEILLTIADKAERIWRLAALAGEP